MPVYTVMGEPSHFTTELNDRLLIDLLWATLKAIENMLESLKGAND